MCIVGAVVVLIVLYSETVSANHALAQTTLSLQKIEAENGEYKDKIFSFIHSDASKALVEERGLVQDKNPEYFELGPQWTFASR